MTTFTLIKILIFVLTGFIWWETVSFSAHMINFPNDLAVFLGIVLFITATWLFVRFSIYLVEKKRKGN